jgi:sugar phosphate isomerase/epimerase
MMKLGCSSWSYHKPISEGRLDQQDWLRLCAEELELDGVELLDIHFPMTSMAYLRELRRLTAGLGLTISCVSVSNDFGLATPEEREAELEKVRQWLDITAYLGAPVLRVFAGWPRPAPSDAASGGARGVDRLLRRIPGLRRRTAKERLWSEMIAYLRTAAYHATESGIVLGLENHNDGGFVGTAAEVERCLREVDSPWLRLNLDTGDYGDLASIERTIDKAVHVHAKLYQLTPEGADTIVDWPGVIAILKKARYRGFLSIEYEGEEPPETAVPRGVRYLRSILHG